MKHFFMEIDGMTVTYGDIVKGRLCDTVPYCVERDDGEGDFDFAQGSLPTCTPVKSKGFAESELWDIESLMRDNMHNIYDQIRGEGAWALEADANDEREAIMYITQSAEIASLERDLVAANKKIEEQDAEIEKRDAEIEELKAKYEKLQAETAFEGDESHGYPKPMDPKDVKARIVGEADEHGRTVLPAEECCEEDDVYDELYPAPFASEAEACDFAEAAARDVIDDRRVNQSPFS